MASPTEPPLDVLLVRLRQGDEKAVEEIFRTYEPYLRLVVRRQLFPAMRAKLDSVDVVQSVWVQLLQDFRRGRWCFSNLSHLKAYLAKATRNRLIDRLRRHRTALEQEERLPDSDEERLPPTDFPRPSQTAQEQEVWQQIQALCSPGQVEIVRLKHQGLTIAEIASQTGRHPSSVRRVLYDLAWQLGVSRKGER
jgi:RNA polymerase sigma-70 factor (ECF subfamily)